jgi:hypothetical protein
MRPNMEANRKITNKMRQRYQSNKRENQRTGNISLHPILGQGFPQLQQQLIKLSTGKVWLNLDQTISNYQLSFGERSIRASVLKQSIQRSIYYKKKSYSILSS